MGRQIFAVAVALAIGFWIGLRSIDAKKSVEEKLVTVHELDDGTKEKLRALSENDIAEYYRLKTLEERYKKADEILGKVMQIFLADLGLKLSQPTVDLVKHPPELAAAAPPPAAPPKPEPPKPAPVKEKREHYYSLASVKNLKDIDEFLALAKIEGQPNASRLSLAFSNREEILSRLKGTFSGFAQILEPGKGPKTWNVVFQLDGTMEGGHFRGQFYSHVEEDGRIIGRTGAISALRDYVSDPSGMLLTVAPATVLQLYYFSNLDVIGGFVYRIKLGGMVPIGSFQLKRPDNPA
jgi:hypothetical protein